MAKYIPTSDQIQLARFAKALGHPMRIAILELLANQAYCCHNDLFEVLPIAKSTLSQHLAELKNAGLVKSLVNPPTVQYSINHENWMQLKNMVNSFMKVRSQEDLSKKIHDAQCKMIK